MAERKLTEVGASCAVAVLLVFSNLLLCIQAQTEPAQLHKDERISLVREQLRSERVKLDSLTAVKQTELEQLNSIDEQIDLNSELLARLDRRLRILRDQESELESETLQLDSSLNRQRARLSISLRNFYLRRQRMPDIILASTDFAHAASQIVYARKSVESLKSTIGATDSLLMKMNDKSRVLESTREEIDYYCKETGIEKKLLQSERARRDRLMNKIRSEEYLYREHLRELETDAREADSVFATSEPIDGESLFESQKGKLPFPLRGEIIKSFGKILDRETQTDIISPGIEIRGDPETEIRAVYDGVVFHRGSLRGYGKVLILDHGVGWYTLYGHLSDYNVVPGQSVRTGDVIGYLGRSAADGASSLHFEIRHRKQQYDPVEWLKLH